MSKFDKAVDFYLRGFNSAYIKRRTGISMQSLLKQLLAKGIKYDKSDIIAYQTAYIRENYTSDEITEAYEHMISTHTNPDKASKSRRVQMLGCGFGQYAKVLRSVLGVSEYQALRDRCWQQKQQETMLRKYGVTNVFDKSVFSDFVSTDALAKGRVKRTDTMLTRYGVEHPNQDPTILAKMLDSTVRTNELRYGVTYPTQDPMIAKKAAIRRQATMKERYGAPNSVQVKHIREKIFQKRKENNTLNTTKPELALGELLRAHFGESDVCHNVLVDGRYPYHVDYYIRSIDLFIELNGDRCHNDHWFDASSSRDNQIVRDWSKNMERIESESGKVSRYRKYIHTWTVTDVEKRQYAKANKLNYLVFWDGSSHQVNKKQVPVLSDVYAWFDAKCPMPCDWYAENTY